MSLYGGGSAVFYTPDPDYCTTGTTTDDFSYQINGGSEALVKVSVNCLDEPPPPRGPRRRPRSSWSTRCSSRTR